ncbi:MAG: hypothetical protein N3F66_08825 [Spirochaetes bacterium]|nr:hypothetical protein [Spirochaetota bacterium]
MDFETTTCISFAHLNILNDCAKRLSIPLSLFIVYLLMYAAKKEKKDYVAFKRIAYRKRDKDNPWKRVHLVVYQSEYEFLLDIKKLWKMSIAHIIAFCVDNVLDEFFLYFEKRLKEINTDNYPNNLPSYYENRSYTFDFFKEKGIHCLKFYWGPPPKILKRAHI